MKISRILYAALAAGLLLALPGCMPVTRTTSFAAAKALQDGNRAALEAERAKGALVQAEKFRAAIKDYDKAASADFKGSAEAAKVVAQARLAKAKILAGVPIESRPEGGLKQVYQTRVPSATAFIYPTTKTLQDDYTARDTFRSVLQDFDHPREKLIADYGPDNAREIEDVVNQAKRYEPMVAQAMDRKNRGDVRYQVMDALVAATGRLRWFSYWFAMVLLSVIVKIIITPLTRAQFKSMKEMQRLQPLVKELQQKYKENKKDLGAKIMDLYKSHGVNPLSGCWPLLIQMPILFLVYSMIRLYEFRFAQGTFLWIGWQPLVHKFGIPLMGGRPVWVTAADLAQPDMILLILYTASMVVSQRLSVVDPTQAEQQKMMSIMMPVMFFFLFGSFPAAFVFYWFMFNVLQTWQQYHIIHGGAPALEPPAPTPATAPSTVRPRQSGRKKRRR